MAGNNLTHMVNLMKEIQIIENEIISNLKVWLNNINISESHLHGEDLMNSYDNLAIRTVQNRINNLRNDYYKLKLEIRKFVTDLFENESESNTEYLEPIAQVNMVMKDSPAEIDGIKLNDLIIQFGDLNQKNFKSLSDFLDIMRRSENRSILVKIRRNDELKTILLTPRRWLGKGLLGCNILPIESIESIER